MERLLLQSSSSPFPLKFQFKYSPLLPQLGRIGSRSLGYSGSGRDNSISCKSRENPFADLSSPSIPRSESWTSQSNSVNGSKPNPDFLKRVYEAVVRRKVTPWKTFILVASITAISLNPMFSLPAFAGSHTATKTGGSVGKKFGEADLFERGLIGFLLGCLQALSGPDHLAALAPLSIGRTRIANAAVGVLWGCGHTFGQVIFFFTFSAKPSLRHVQLIRTWCVRVVGLTLLLIGATGIKEASQFQDHYVASKTEETDMSHPQPEITEGLKKKPGFSAFAIGVVHGTQPDWLMFVLPGLIIPLFSEFSFGLFLIMFMVGMVVAMGSYTVLIGSCSQALEDRVPKIREKLIWVSSLVAIALGLAIIFTKLYDSPLRKMDCLGKFFDPTFSRKYG